MPFLCKGPRPLERLSQHLRPDQEFRDRLVAKIDQCEIGGGAFLVQDKDLLHQPPNEHLRPGQPLEFGQRNRDRIQKGCLRGRGHRCKTVRQGDLSSRVPYSSGCGVDGDRCARDAIHVTPHLERVQNALSGELLLESRCCEEVTAAAPERFDLAKHDDPAKRTCEVHPDEYLDGPVESHLLGRQIRGEEGVADQSLLSGDGVDPVGPRRRVAGPAGP